MDIPKEITLIPLVTAKTAGILHPIIFGLNNRDIRRTVRSRFGYFCHFFYITRRSRADERKQTSEEYENPINDQENEIIHKNNTNRQSTDTSNDLDKNETIPLSLTTTIV